MSYKGIFDEAQEVSKTVDYSALFPEFHDHPELFHFIMSPRHQESPDGGSLALAYQLNPEVYEYLFDVGPSMLGNGSTMLDGAESRHILMLTYLITFIGKEWGNVVEIGGGYGNFARLVDGFVAYDKWTIIDLDYISDLQKWFHQTLIPDATNIIYRHSNDEIDGLEPTLVIGTHSLSEFSLDDFIRYYNEVIQYSTWFFYVSQAALPSKELLTNKLDIICKDFSLEHTRRYEDDASILYIFKRME
jgi:hypothetical protein